MTDYLKRRASEAKDRGMEILVIDFLREIARRDWWSQAAAKGR